MRLLSIAVPVHAGSTRALVALRDCIDARMFGVQRTHRAVCVSVRATFPMPAKWSKARRDSGIARRTLHTKKPDAADIAVLAKRALVGLVVKSATQLVSVTVHKDWGPHSRLEVEVAEVPTA